MRPVTRHLLTVFLAAGLPSCAGLRHQSPPDYRTIAADPHHDMERARVETERAIKLMEKCKWHDAELALQQALIADVTYGPAHNNLGHLYFSQGNYYLAAWEFEYASRLMPERPEPQNNLGLLYEEVGKIDEAVGFFEAALEIQPQNPNVIGNLARARLRRGDRASEVHSLLLDLQLYDTRPDWIEWAKETLALTDVT